jgi:ubiquinone/menaquinone biosynthesis C-methylase UbiE
MLEVAARKASAERLINVEFRQCDAMALRFSPQSLAGALSVHSLYAFAEPNRVLHKLHGWLKPGAPVLLCNLGRQLQVSNWAKFLFKHVRARAGMYRAVELFVRGRQVARQNNHISKKQRLGEYWTHSPEQFCDAVKAAGFVVHSQLKLYRGCSDLILGTRGAA